MEGSFSFHSCRIDPYETRNIAQEKPEIVESLWPLLKKGKTEFMPDLWNFKEVKQ